MPFLRARFTACQYISLCMIPLYNYTTEDREGVKEEDGPVLDHHPNHVVVIDTQPQFGPSLSSMVEETELSNNHKTIRLL